MPLTFTFQAAVAGAEAAATAPRDLALDPTTGDLELVDGDLPLVIGADAVASDLQARLQTVAGEWFLDTSIGLPFFTEISDRPRPQRLDELFRAEILGTPGVSSLDQLAFTSEPGRLLVVTFKATLELGGVVEATLRATPGGE